MRRVPRLVWLLTVLSFLMSISSSLIIPTYFGFDEPQHVDMVVAIVHGDGWADPGKRHLALGVARTGDLYYNPGSDTRPLDVGLRTIPPRGERPSVPEAGGYGPKPTGLPNQIVLHPPLYYALVAAGVAVVGADNWSYDRLIAWMRILTALMAAAIPLLTWAICRRLGTSETVGVAAAALTLAVPGLTRLTGMVNNDPFLVVTTTGLLLALVHVVTGDLSRRLALLVGGLTAAALLSKGFGLPLPLLVVGAYLLGARRAREGSRRALVPMAYALGVGFVFGGLWWVRNLIAFGAVQPNGYGTQAIYNRPNQRGGGGPLDFYVHGVINLLTRSFWGGVGHLSSPTISLKLANEISLLALLGILAAIIWGIRGVRHRGALLLLVAPMLLALVIVVQGSWPVYEQRGQIRGVQGRYLYLAVPGIAICLAVIGERLLWRARALLPALAITAMILMQAVSGYRVIKRLWFAPGPGNSLRTALNHLEVLSPWPNGITQGVFALTALLALAALALAGYEAAQTFTRSDPAPASLPEPARGAAAV
jgi:4-amino-4-deoxy-L-arabinose transferase-like glycosyltransferase